MKFHTKYGGGSSARGSLLVLTLWVLAFLSIFTLAVGYTVQQRLRVVANLEVRENLRFAAEAGVKLAMSVLNKKLRVPPFFDTLNQDWSANGMKYFGVKVGKGEFFIPKYDLTVKEKPKVNDPLFLYGMVDEESKIQINHVKSAHILTRLFQAAAGLSREEASNLADSILDFNDEDEFSNPGGAESRYYKSLPIPYVAKNKPFDTLEELLFVKGMTPEIFRKVRPYLTLYGDGKVNVNTASEPVLKAVGFSASLIRKILSYRAGRDQQEGTMDDGGFMDVSNMVPLLISFASLDEAEQKLILSLIQSGLIDVASKNFSIQSVARHEHKNQILVVECVTERYGKIKSWHETYKTIMPQQMTGVSS